MTPPRLLRRREKAFSSSPTSVKVVVENDPSRSFMEKFTGQVFGVIGAGFIGGIHLAALKAVGLRVGAIADPFPAALAKAGKQNPGARLYSDWRELLSDPAITAVNICTINSLHFEILSAAVASGRHVFCEKTMTVKAKQARQALELQLAPGQVVQIGYMKRFFPASQWMKEHLPEIGKPLCATVRSFQGGFVEEGETIYHSPDWRPGPNGPSRTRTFASGGMLNMAGSHMLDMTAWLLGQPREITCRTWSPSDYDAEMHVHGLFGMANDVLVHFEACLAPYHGTGIFGDGWDEYIQIDGTKGRIEIYYPRWDKPMDFPVRCRLYRESARSWEEPAFEPVNVFHLEMTAFDQACTDGQCSGPTIAEAAAVDLWIDACYTSVRENRTTYLD
jgi:predicted dehydrogenase